MRLKTFVRLVSFTFICATLPPAFAAGNIEIQKSKYVKGRSGELQVSVKLNGFQGKQLVELFGGNPPVLLASDSTKKNLVLKARNFTDANPPPCVIRVAVGEVSVQADVEGAPENCVEPPSLALEGTVRDNPIPFATVVVTVGGVTYTTVADENGDFFIEIASLDLSALVLIESLGENPNDETRTVDMVSLAGTFSKLLEDADGDGIVDGTENPNINNTPYTTALFVLLVQGNGGEPPTTLEELQAAEKTVEATEVLQLAAVIKLLVDDPDYELPIDPGTGEPYPSILEFLADSEVDGDGNTPVDNFIVDNQEDVDDAVEVILEDAGIIPAFTAAEIPDRYYPIVPAQIGFTSRQGGALLFERSPDTGVTREAFNGLPVPGSFDWGVTDGRLVLDFTVEPEITRFLFPDPEQTLRCREPDDPQFAACPHTCADYEHAALFASTPLSVTGTELERSYTRYAISPGGTREFASTSSDFFTEYSSFTYDDGGGAQSFQFCDEFESTIANVELLNGATTVPKRLEVDDFAGETLAIYVLYDPEGGSSTGMYMDFATLGTGTPDGDGYRAVSTLLSTASLEWRIVDGGGAPSDTNDDGSADGDELQFRYSSGELQSMRQLEPSVGLETGFFFEVTGVPVPYGHYDIFLRADPAFAFSAPYISNNSGEYWQGTINSWNKANWFTNQDGILELQPGQEFGWEFASNFTGANLQSGGGVVGMNFWSLLAIDTEAGNGQLEPLPAGTLQINYRPPANARNRYWIPIDDTLIDVPSDVAHAPATRQRFYVVEVEFNPNGSMRIPPRINSDEIFYKTIFQ